MPNETIIPPQATPPVAPPAAPPPAATQVESGTPPAALAPNNGSPPAAASGNGAVVGDNGFPANWRDTFAEQIAPGDANFRTRLDRFTAPYDVGKSWRALEQKQSSGELKSQLPKEATPEQVAQWRKDNGIPEKPDGYVEKLTLSNGTVLGAEDKPIVAMFAEVAHADNISPAAFSKFVDQYYKIQDAFLQKQQDIDGAFRQESENELRNKWGPDYTANTTAMGNLLNRLPEITRLDGKKGSFAEELKGARVYAPTKENLGRTVPLGSHPAFIAWAAEMEREINPTATLLPSSGGDPVAGLKTELEQIAKLSRENPDAYNADKAMQARRLQLTEAQNKLNARGQQAR